MPNDYQMVRQKRKDDDPQNKSRIVIEPAPEEQSPAEHAREKLGVINRFGKEYQKKEFSGQEPVQVT